MAWTKQKLSDCVTFRTGKLNSNAAVKDGMYPFFTCSQEIYKTNTWSFDTECVLLAGNNAKAVYPIFYYKGKFDAYQRTYVIEQKNDNYIRFFYFVLRKKLEDLKQRSTGATTRFLTIKILHNLHIVVPELSEQRKIASLLSAYDDLLENNEKRIKILEEMAQRLYAEWFVKFKFPGHEKVMMVDSGTEFGMIPEGWNVKKIKEIGKVVTGKTPSTTKTEYFGQDICFIKTPDMHGNIFLLNTTQKLSELGAESQKSKTLPIKTVFVSCIGTLGAVAITSELSQTNQQINSTILDDRDDYIMFYFFLKTLLKS